jgi:predicted RNA binding protein YcfA (HicA-like mRNA interferase family)
MFNGSQLESNQTYYSISKGHPAVNKQYRELRNLLENAGFVLVKDGNHVIFEKEGKTICVTKNVRDPKRLFKKALGQWKSSPIV